MSKITLSKLARKNDFHDILRELIRFFDWRVQLQVHDYICDNYADSIFKDFDITCKLDQRLLKNELPYIVQSEILCDAIEKVINEGDFLILFSTRIDYRIVKNLVLLCNNADEVLYVYSLFNINEYQTRYDLVAVSSEHLCLARPLFDKNAFYEDRGSCNWLWQTQSSCNEYLVRDNVIKYNLHPYFYTDNFWLGSKWKNLSKNEISYFLNNVEHFTKKVFDGLFVSCEDLGGSNKFISFYSKKYTDEQVIIYLKKFLKIHGKLPDKLSKEDIEIKMHSVMQDSIQGVKSVTAIKNKTINNAIRTLLDYYE